MLTTPKRNRYFRGKLLDVDHFELEQTYFNDKRWLINRLAVGGGVLDGLACELIGNGPLLQINPGVAIDPSGHEIIVSELSPPFDPRALTDQDGNPTGIRIEDAGTVLVGLRYLECCVDPMPIFGDDCDLAEGCSESLWEERYAIIVLDFKFVDLGEELPYVVLARIELPEDDAAITIVNDMRTQIGSNLMLLERILSLEARFGPHFIPPLTIVQKSWSHEGELQSLEFAMNGLSLTLSDPISSLPNTLGWLCVTIEYPSKTRSVSSGIEFGIETVATERLQVTCGLEEGESKILSIRVGSDFDANFRSLCAQTGCQDSGVLCRVRIKLGSLSGQGIPNGSAEIGIPGIDFESWFTLRPTLER